MKIICVLIVTVFPAFSLGLRISKIQYKAEHEDDKKVEYVFVFIVFLITEALLYGAGLFDIFLK